MVGLVGVVGERNGVGSIEPFKCSVKLSELLGGGSHLKSDSGLRGDIARGGMAGSSLVAT